MKIVKNEFNNNPQILNLKNNIFDIDFDYIFNFSLFPIPFDRSNKTFSDILDLSKLLRIKTLKEISKIFESRGVRFNDPSINKPVWWKENFTKTIGSTFRSLSQDRRNKYHSANSVVTLTIIFIEKVPNKIPRIFLPNREDLYIFLALDTKHRVYIVE